MKTCAALLCSVRALQQKLQKLAHFQWMEKWTQRSDDLNSHLRIWLHLLFMHVMLQIYVCTFCIKKSDEWPKNLNDYQIFVPLCKSAIFNFCWLVQFSGAPISKIAIFVTDCCEHQNESQLLCDVDDLDLPVLILTSSIFSDVECVIKKRSWVSVFSISGSFNL